MDVIQEFGYICAVEELNKAIESFEPATESAIDTIKNIAKRFWNFVMMLARKAINAVLSVIRKLKSEKSITINDKVHLDSMVVNEVPELMHMCQKAYDSVYKGALSSSADQMDDIAEQLQEMHERAKDIGRSIYSRLELFNDKSGPKTIIKADRLNNIIKNFSNCAETLKGFEVNARHNAVGAVNNIEKWTEDSNSVDYQKEYVRMYTNAQALYNTSLSAIIDIINHFNKL